MILYCLMTDSQQACDFLVTHSPHNTSQYFHFAVRERMKRRTRFAVGTPGTVHLFIYPVIQFTAGEYIAGNRVLAIRNSSNSAGKDFRFNIFGTIPDCTSEHSMNRLFDIIISCQQDNAGGQMFRGDLVGYLLTIQSRHVYVQDCHLRLEFADPFNRFRPVRGLRKDSKIFLQGKRVYYTLTEERMIVRDDQCYLIHLYLLT